MIVQSYPRFDFKQMNGSGRDVQKNSLKTNIACLVVGVLIGLVSGFAIARTTSEVRFADISEDTLERIRLGAENLKLKRELSERRKEVVQ